MDNKEEILKVSEEEIEVINEEENIDTLEEKNLSEVTVLIPDFNKYSNITSNYPSTQISPTTGRNAKINFGYYTKLDRSTPPNSTDIYQLVPDINNNNIPIAVKTTFPSPSYPYNVNYANWMRVRIEFKISPYNSAKYNVTANVYIGSNRWMNVSNCTANIKFELRYVNKLTGTNNAIYFNEDASISFNNFDSDYQPSNDDDPFIWNNDQNADGSSTPIPNFHIFKLIDAYTDKVTISNISISFSPSMNWVRYNYLLNRGPKNQINHYTSTDELRKKNLEELGLSFPLQFSNRESDYYSKKINGSDGININEVFIPSIDNNGIDISLSSLPVYSKPEFNLSYTNLTYNSVKIPITMLNTNSQEYNQLKVYYGYSYNSVANNVSNHGINYSTKSGSISLSLSDNTKYTIYIKIENNVNNVTRYTINSITFTTPKAPPIISSITNNSGSGNVSSSTNSFSVNVNYKYAERLAYGYSIIDSSGNVSGFTGWTHTDVAYNSGSNKIITISNLTPGVKYEFKVALKNSNYDYSVPSGSGTNDRTKIFIIRTKQEVPKISEITNGSRLNNTTDVSTSINSIRFNATFSNSTQYAYRYKKSTDSSYSAWVFPYSNGYNYNAVRSCSILLENLTPNTYYNIEFRVKNDDYGYSESNTSMTKIITIRTRKRKPSLVSIFNNNKLKDETERNILQNNSKISCSVSNSTNSIRVGINYKNTERYAVKYYRKGSDDLSGPFTLGKDWEHITTGLSLNNDNQQTLNKDLTNLTTDSVYEIHVAIENSDWGYDTSDREMTKIFYVRTKFVAPVVSIDQVITGLDMVQALWTSNKTIGSMIYYYSDSSATITYTGDVTKSFKTTLKTATTTLYPNTTYNISINFTTISKYDNMTTTKTFNFTTKDIAKFSSMVSLIVSGNLVATKTNPSNERNDLDIYLNDNYLWKTVNNLTSNSINISFNDTEITNSYKQFLNPSNPNKTYADHNRVKAKYILTTTSSHTGKKYNYTVNNVYLSLTGDIKTTYTNKGNSIKRGKAFCKKDNAIKKAVTWIKVNGRWRRGI